MYLKFAGRFTTKDRAATEDLLYQLQALNSQILEGFLLTFYKLTNPRVFSKARCFPTLTNKSFSCEAKMPFNINTADEHHPASRPFDTQSNTVLAAFSAWKYKTWQRERLRQTVHGRAHRHPTISRLKHITTKQFCP